MSEMTMTTPPTQAQAKKRRKRSRSRSRRRPSKKPKVVQQIPEILRKSENPIVHRKIESFSNFTRVDGPEQVEKEVERKHKPVKMNKGKHTIVVTNPHGTGFMAKAGMHAILVKFQEHHANLNLKPGTLYTLALKDDGIGEIEMLYFTTKPEGHAGEMILLKWHKDHLKPVNTVMRGTDLDKGMYKVEDGHTWEVEAIYEIRSQAPGKNVISEIRKDIKFLESLKRKRTRLAKKAAMRS